MTTTEYFYIGLFVFGIIVLTVVIAFRSMVIESFDPFEYLTNQITRFADLRRESFNNFRRLIFAFKYEQKINNLRSIADKSIIFPLILVYFILFLFQQIVLQKDQKYVYDFIISLLPLLTGIVIGYFIYCIKKLERKIKGG